MQINQTIILTEEVAGMRFDQALAKLLPEYSRARLQSWIKAGYVTVDGKLLRASEKIHVGQIISIAAQIEAEQRWQPQSIQLNILYEDADLLIINKPVGLVVHPGAGNQDQTLVNALLHYAPELAHVPRAGIVHRLDKDTSGLLVVARNLLSHKQLVTAIQERTVKREYLAIVNGVMIAGGTIKTALGRHPVQRTRMAVVDLGKEAITHYRVSERFRHHTSIKVQLETGRTHQIRVHMAHIHHALVGDLVYGRLRLPAGGTEELKIGLQHFKRQALHACALELQHPITQQLVRWEAPLPEDMLTLLDLLREDAKIKK